MHQPQTHPLSDFMTLYVDNGVECPKSKGLVVAATSLCGRAAAFILIIQALSYEGSSGTIQDANHSLSSFRLLHNLDLDRCFFHHDDYVCVRILTFRFVRLKKCTHQDVSTAEYERCIAAVQGHELAGVMILTRTPESDPSATNFFVPMN